MSQARKTVTAVCIVAALAALVVAEIAAPASSLSLPGITVTTPTPPLPVKTPTVPVKTPTLPVKTPPIRIEVPPVTVKTPTPPVKVPTLPVKAPTTPVPSPAPSGLTSTKTPTVNAKTPTISARAPSVGASSPSVSVKGPSVGVGGSTGSARGAAGSEQQSAGAAPAGGQGSPSTGATAGGGAGAEGAGPGASSVPAPLGAYGVTGGDYGQLPVVEGRHGPRALARIARRERALKEKVARFQGCLGDLPATQRELLELRTGLGASRPLAARVVASRLHVAPKRFALLERRAVRELSDAASTHACSQTSELVARVASFLGAGFGGAQPAATGGVEAVSYSLALPAKALGDRSSTMVGRILGADIPPVASDLILVLLLTMGTGVLVVAVLADGAGLGPRHQQWRRRVMNRNRWLR
jgi:hypothetical protein